MSPSAEQFRRWGVDPGWSAMVQTPAGHAWHVLERGPARPLATVVCVHGNPTWSYLWRSFHHRLGDRYRVIAVDQLGMGFSARTPRRRFTDRVDDLEHVIEALNVTGPVVVAAHDWGGPIALGWALRHDVAAVALSNTGVAVPEGRKAPALIRLAAAGPLTDFVAHRTPLFVEGTLALSMRRISSAAREAYRAPYRSPRHRWAIAEFVDDIPFAPSHPSAAAIAEVAAGIRALSAPVMLAWGSRDPVFNDDFAADLHARMPHADRHRFPRAGHLSVEEADVAGVVDTWLGDRFARTRPAEAPPARPVAATSTAAVSGSAGTAHPPIWSALDARRGDESPGFVDGSSGRTTSFAVMSDRVFRTAAGLGAIGVEPGIRVAVLVPPGIDLITTAFGCWRAGAVTVIADRGLGLRGLGQAVKAARADWVIGPPRAIAAARLLRWARGARTVVVGRRRTLGCSATLDELARSEAAAPPEPEPASAAAVLYTSGATGPAKGVRYNHGQMAAQLAALRSMYSIGDDDRLVAAFAPFALYGPALGITSTIPDVDVTTPGALTADALVAAVTSIRATIVFAAPAALANVVRTAAPGTNLDGVRLVLSAGAPVPIATLRATARFAPGAELHTPYGMTECLPVADVSLAELDAAGDGAGVCVGRTVEGVSVLIAPIGFDAARRLDHVETGGLGEVLVRAPWLSVGYDQLWRTERDARPRDAAGAAWHRTGDVGHIDAAGRLWIEGRSVHLIDAATGPLAPVPVEVAVERLDGVERSAAVGVGPAGCQQLVVVIEDVSRPFGLAAAEVTAAVRGAVHQPVAAVLTIPALPVDIRHNTKIDRTAVATWAGVLLAGAGGR